jgi:hypothetical protein
LQVDLVGGDDASVGVPAPVRHYRQHHTLNAAQITKRLQNHIKLEYVKNLGSFKDNDEKSNTKN